MIYKNKRFLVTGACGTIGSAIVKKLLSLKSIVCAFDISENGLFNLEKQLGPKYNNKIKIFLGSIRNVERLSKAMNRVDYVIHCAALKHVEIAEYNPFESVLTNIIGVQNIIDVALEKNVKRVLFTSSDKSVNPSSVMGTTKLMGEKLIIAANNYSGKKITRFSSVRFGNVLDSSGSVIEIFKRQIREESALTITSKKMTRFFINIEQAVDLCIYSLNKMIGGEIFFPNMKCFDILSLAKSLTSSKNFKFKFTKPSIGEKLYEELATKNEASRTYYDGSYYVIIPEVGKYAQKFIKKVNEKYKNLEKINPLNLKSSENLLSVPEIQSLLQKSNII